MSSNCGPCNGNGSFMGRTCAYCNGSGESKEKVAAFADLRRECRKAEEAQRARLDAFDNFGHARYGSVRQLLAGEVSPGVVNHTTRFDNAIREAVSAAKNAGIPQGFIVALLHAHAARETSQLLE